MKQAHYYYRLDPELAVVEIFLRFSDKGKPPAHGTPILQIIHDGSRVRLLNVKGPPPSELRFWHEAGKPPIELDPTPPILETKDRSPCIYCGRLGLPIQVTTAWSLPLYLPRGHTCPSCHRTVVILD